MLSRNEFLERRKVGIGGSDVAALLGLSKWKTPFQLWQEKTGRVESDQQSEIMHFGNVLEQVVADEFSRRNSLKVERRNKMFVVDGILLANIDRKIVFQRALLECKTADKFTGHLWGDDGTNEIPEYYLTQFTHYQYVTGYRDIGFLAVLIGGNEYRQYPITYNPDLGDYIAEKCINWWDTHVVKDTPPPAIASDDLNSYYKLTTGSSVAVDADTHAHLINLKNIKKTLKELTEEKEEHEFVIKNFMAEHDVLLDTDGSKLATWKGSKSKRIDVKALRLEEPEIATQYTSESSSRRFLLK